MALAVGGHRGLFFGPCVEAEAGSLCSWWRRGCEVAEQGAAWAPGVFGKKGCSQGFLWALIAEWDCDMQRRASSA